MKSTLFLILTTLTLIQGNQETPVLKRCYVTQEIQQREEQKFIDKINKERETKKKAEEQLKRAEEERTKKETERKQRELKRAEEEKCKKEELKKAQEEKRKAEEERIKKEEQIEEERIKKEEKENAQRAFEQQISKPNSITIKGRTFPLVTGGQSSIDNNTDSITIVTSIAARRQVKYTEKTHSDDTSWFGALHDYNGGNLLWDTPEYIYYTDVNGLTKKYFLEFVSPLRQYPVPDSYDLYNMELGAGFVPNRIAIQTCQGYGNGVDRFYVFREEGYSDSSYETPFFFCDNYSYDVCVHDN